MNHKYKNRHETPVINPRNNNHLSIPSLGWGRGSGSNALYRVHLELLNQSVCDNNLSSNFNQSLMICAGNLENGGRGACSVRTLLK